MPLPNTNISIGLVADELNIDTTDLKELCTSPNIKKWSKWKPISSSDSTLTEQLLVGLNYGLYLNDVFDNDYIGAANSGYFYNKPTGGRFSRFRLGDFRNYNHQAISPIGMNPTVKNPVVNSFYNNAKTLNYFLTKPESSNSITLYNLPLIGTYYLGVVITDPANNNSVVSVVTAQNPISFNDVNSSINIDFTMSPFSNVTNKVYNIYHVLFQNHRIQGDPIGENNYRPLPSDSNGVGTLTLTKDSGLSTVTNDISRNTQPTFTFGTLSRHTDRVPIGGLAEYYQTQRAVFFKTYLTNTTTEQIYFELYKLWMSFSMTFKRSTSYSFKPVVYNNLNQNISNSAIYIAPNQTVELIVGGVDVMNRGAGDVIMSVNSSDIANPSVIMSYNNSVFWSVPPIRLQGMN